MEQQVELAELGLRLKELRQARGLTGMQLADLTGVSNSHISRVERGESAPSFRLLVGLASRFSLNVVWLAYGIGDPYIRKTDRTSVDAGLLVRELSELVARHADTLGVAEAARRGLSQGSFFLLERIESLLRQSSGSVAPGLEAAVAALEAQRGEDAPAEATKTA